MTVRFYATLRPIVGGPRVEVELADGATVQDLIDHLVERWPALAELMLNENGALSRYVHVLVNGRGAQYLQGGLATALQTDHKIDVFPAVAGG